MRRLPFLAVVALLALSVLVIPSSRRADATTTTWTSTSDFDSGAKGNITVNGSWSWKAPQPGNWGGQSAITYNYHGYVFSGYSAGVVTNITWRYNPGSNTWTTLANMPDRRVSAAVASWADRIYLFSGIKTGAPLTNVSYYNVTSNTWTAGLNADPVPQEATMATTYGTYIYLSDGTNHVRRYFPSNDSYQDMGCTITSGTVATHAVIGSYWYFIGGGAFDNKVRRFNFLTHACDNAYDTFAFTPKSGMGWTSDAGINGRIYVAGGYTSSPNRFYRDVWEYDPANKTWRQMESISVQRNLSNFVINGTYYAIGGFADQHSITGLPLLEALNPSVNSHDGHSLVETYTDSKNVANGTFKLATGTTDAFYQNNHFGDPYFWTHKTDGIGVPTLGHGDCNYTVNAGNLSIIQPVAFADAGGPYCSLMTPWTWSGDFDVRAKVAAWGTTASSGQAIFQVLNEPVVRGTGFSATVDGAEFFIGQNLGGFVQSYTLLNGALTQCHAVASSLGNSLYLRITLTGTTWAFYYSTNGASWVAFGSCVNAVTGPWYGVFENNPPASAGLVQGISVKDFWFQSGTPGTGSYRTSGAWTSPLHVYAGDTAKYVNVTYSGASASTYISQVRVLNATGTVLFTDSTHLTTGTSHSYLLTGGATLHQNFTVEVSLAGNGAESVAVESVSLYTQPPLTTTIGATPANGYIPDTVAFTTTPTYGTAPFNYTWSFGDGKFAYTQNPSHVYTSSGDFAANITVTDAGGETATNTTTVRVRAPVVATGSATPTSGTYPLAVNFTATQTGGFAPFTYFWNFGDGTNSTTRNVTHTYTTYGFYAVTLRVTDTYGNVGTTTVHITVRPPDDVLWSGFLILLVLFLVFMGIGMVIHSPVWVLLSSFFGIFAALALALNLALFPYALVVVLLMFGFSLLTMIGSAFAMIGGGGGGL